MENIKVSQRVMLPKDAIIYIGLYLELFNAIAHSDIKKGCIKAYFVRLLNTNTKYGDQILQLKFDESVFINHTKLLLS